MVNCMECIHIDVCIKAATSHIDHCNYYSFAGNTVEVVRCRECKFGDWDSEPDDAMVCMRTEDGFWRSGNDFCSYGERKEGDD